MPLGTEVGLGAGHIVLDGDRPPPTERGTAAPTFRAMSIVGKRLPISETVELVWLVPKSTSFCLSVGLAVCLLVALHD